MAVSPLTGMPVSYNPYKSAGLGRNPEPDRPDAAAQPAGRPLDGPRQDGEAVTGLERAMEGGGECRTCQNRKYQDGSDDPGVSFKTPTQIDPEQAGSAVRAHELEHVYRNQAKAAREDRKVLYQSVVLHTAICPECGRAYISGGTTRTVTSGKEAASLFDVGREQGKGRLTAQA